VVRQVADDEQGQDVRIGWCVDPERADDGRGNAAHIGERIGDRCESSANLGVCSMRLPVTPPRENNCA